MKKIKILGIASLLTVLLFSQSNKVFASTKNSVIETKSDRRFDYDNDEYWENHMKNKDNYSDKDWQDHHKNMRNSHRTSTNRRHCH
ncbi:hypothetical protein ERUR111494_03885 [Erysipelothrix urinaevulpis]|uniref:hypothetical protein n=1 Tax=Erysipelothrix urinaevulpis TaxID=2683717 RepID=UPI00135BE23C|nr:hypothetical protein [Erysipelothrix urinaevulpis]